MDIIKIGYTSFRDVHKVAKMSKDVFCSTFKKVTNGKQEKVYRLFHIEYEKLYPKLKKKEKVVDSEK